jgi:hypothetical protein
MLQGEDGLLRYARKDRSILTSHIATAFLDLKPQIKYSHCTAEMVVFMCKTL